jgi:hypothetical protein
MPADLPMHTLVRVWPGARPGRSGVTHTVTDAREVDGDPCVYVSSTTDSDGRRVPGGLYALTHVEREEASDAR